MVVQGDGGKKHSGLLGFDAYGARVGALAWIVEDRNLNAALDTALKFAPRVRTVHGRATALRSDSDTGAATSCWKMAGRWVRRWWWGRMAASPGCATSAISGSITGHIASAVW